MAENQEIIHHQVVRGFPCPFSERFTRKKIEDAMDFEPGDCDLILASYPKTGTTWLQYILLQIRSKGEFFPSLGEASHKHVPFLELVGVEVVKAQGKPRFYRHHIPYNFVKKNEKSKCIYIYRHPEDTVLSYYHFLQGVIPHFSSDFSKYLKNFATGNIPYGSYFQHVKSFYEHSDDSNIFMVSYEKLHLNRKEEILKIAEFLGDEYYRFLTTDKELLDRIIEHTNFDYMKKNLYFDHPSNTKHQTEKNEKGKVEFFRKGVVGDGKNALSVEQRQLLRQAASKVLNDTAVIKEWYPECQ